MIQSAVAGQRLHLPQIQEKHSNNENHKLSPTKNIPAQSNFSPYLKGKIIKHPHYNYKDSVNKQQQGYPKLTKMVENTLSNQQQKALKTIIQKKPALAASLDLYANPQVIFIYKDKQHKLINDNSFNQQYYFQNQSKQNLKANQEIDSDQQRIIKDLQKIAEVREKLEKSQKITLLPYFNPKFQNDNFPQQDFTQYNQFKYYIGKGNNSDLVRIILSKRENWKEVPSNYSVINFVWLPFSNGFKFEKLNPKLSNQKRMINHFEYHKELTTKSGLLRNMSAFCEENKLNIFDIVPLTFQIDLNDRNWEYDLYYFMDFFVSHQPKGYAFDKKRIEIKKKFKIISVEKNLRLQQSIYGPQMSEFIRPIMHPCFTNGSNYVWLMKPTNLNRGRGIEVFNNLEQLEKLFNQYYEGYLERNLQQMGQANQTKQNEEIKQSDNEQTNQQQQVSQPETNDNIVKIDENNNQQQKDDQQQQIIEAQQIVNKHGLSQSFIEQDNRQTVSTQNTKALQLQTVDSQQLLDQKRSKSHSPQPKDQLEGNNIIQNNITTTNQQLQQQSAQQQKATADNNQWFVIKEHSFVIQKYVEHPLLIYNRKFDIRIWVLLTGQLDVYMFKEGYLRTSSEEFTLNNIDNPFIHLTNNAVQKYSSTFGQFENANQMGFQEFEAYIKANKLNCDLYGKAIPKMKQDIVMSMQSVRHKINRQDRRNCFEIFGYDFIIDANGEVWLIEVNTNPCIELSSPMLEAYIPRMIDDAFKLTLDQIFPPVFTKNNKGKEGTKNNDINSTFNNTYTIAKPSNNNNVTDQQDVNSNLRTRTLSNEKDKLANDEQLENNNELNDMIAKQQKIDLQSNLIEDKRIKSFWPVKGYSDYDNMWDFLYGLSTYKRSVVFQKRW